MRYHALFKRVISFAFAGLMFASSAQGEPAALTDLQVYPPDVHLDTFRSRQSFVVQATYTDGITRDVTAEAKATLANPALVKLEKGVAYPLADGTTEMKVEFGGRAVVVPVQIKNAKADRPISFKLDVMPVFMKSGCNQGSCHGAAGARMASAWRSSDSIRTGTTTV